MRYLTQTVIIIFKIMQIGITGEGLRKHGLQARIKIKKIEHDIPVKGITLK
jgi:hypothetical protein